MDNETSLFLPSPARNRRVPSHTAELRGGFQGVLQMCPRAKRLPFTAIVLIPRYYHVAIIAAGLNLYLDGSIKGPRLQTCFGGAFEGNTSEMGGGGGGGEGVGEGWGGCRMSARLHFQSPCHYARSAQPLAAFLSSFSPVIFFSEKQM